MVTSALREPMAEQELAAVLWAATDKAAAKEVDRDALPAGESRHVRLMITGEIDGQTIHRSLHGTLNIGHDQQRAVSATPQQGTLVALILSKLNEATREKILTGLPRQFAADGQWPEVSAELVQAAETMLRQIRATKTINVHGNIRFNYDLGGQTNRPSRRGPLPNGRPARDTRCHEPRNCRK